ncbi:MAG: hypothetical protein DRQ88_01950 [Epsilonproteobacteria bacterium]|nr:MAG: hypothetical protein DRQ89_00695 [Campylobacterota bacterium]RLA67626.1 MAG: hypothetical protein DRQ88_01950 [Campylobacterota bacterium]
MKIALTIDHLIAREHSTAIFEEIMGLYKDAEIWTIVHNEGAVLGPIEMRKIHSSFLSHKVKDKKKFKKLSFLVPSAANKLFIPCSFDLIINISTGLSHGIKKCKETKQITYLYDFNLLKDETITGKIFKGYLKKWSLNKIKQSDLLLTSSKFLNQSLGLNGKVVYPFFKLEDFPLIPSTHWKHDFFVINGEGLTLKAANELISYLKKDNQKYCFIGDLPKGLEIPMDLNMGNKCNGELAPLLASSKGLIHFAQSSFPQNPLKNLSVGRPLLIKDSPLNREFFENRPGVTFFSNDDLFSKMESFNTSITPEKIRATAMKYQSLGFKGQFKRQVEQFIKE